MQMSANSLFGNRSSITALDRGLLAVLLALAVAIAVTKVGAEPGGYSYSGVEILTRGHSAA